MIRAAIVGLGKMGLSHLSIVRAHPEIQVVGVCDTAGYLRDVLEKYTGLTTFGDFDRMLDAVEIDCVFIATPSRLHGGMVRKALERRVHVFCEKPFVLDVAEGEALVALAAEKQLVNQVGYHFRFVAAFQEARRIVRSGALGTVHHVRAEAYGPVVLRPSGSTWRSSKSEGGGCVQDYACHAIDLVNFVFELPIDVSGSVLGRVFSRDVEDEVYATLHFAGGRTGQLCVNWSDESHRKMSTKITVWGTNGRLTADRQECQVYLRAPAVALPDLSTGWTVRYTTDLTPPVWFYLRGEEYSAQVDHFVSCIKDRSRENISTFASALGTDRFVAKIVQDAEQRPTAPEVGRGGDRKRFFGLFE
jgi:scyllo-inositol 2-dehydrogenase (NADP+)